MQLKYIASLTVALCFLPKLVFGQLLIMPPGPGGVAITNMGDHEVGITYIFSNSFCREKIGANKEISFHTWDFDRPLLAVFSPSEDVVGTFIY